MVNTTELQIGIHDSKGLFDMITTIRTAVPASGDDERVTMTVPEAGKKLGISRNGSYEAAARGDIPTIRIGRLLRVPKSAFSRLLEGK